MGKEIDRHWFWGQILMKAPIFVYETNNLDVFESVSAAERYVEPPDVLSGVFSAYDSEGRLLKLAVSADGRRVVVQPGESIPQHVQELVTIITAFLAAVGVPSEWLGSASLPELVNKALEYRTK